jgi:hypothetical protein
MDTQESTTHAADEVVVETTQTEAVAPQVHQINQGRLAMKKPVIALLVILIIGAGVGTGFGASRLMPQAPEATPQAGAPGTITAESVEVGKIYGNDDKETFPDVSEGIIAEGGIDGEGTHHLIRPGGATQTVYLTSSTVDLDPFINHKVQVRGETFSAQKAAWFMDVGSVKVIQLNVAKDSPESAEEL